MEGCSPTTVHGETTDWRLWEVTTSVMKSFSINRCLQITLIVSIIGAMVSFLLLLSRWSLATDSAHANAIFVGLVTDENTLVDQTWNWTSYQGLLRAESELGVVGKVYTSTSSVDYGPNLQQCVSDGNNLCISVGSSMADATWNIAQANPAVDFAIVDFAWNEAYPDNVRGMDFAVNETGFLAGTLAGLITESDVIGAIGGFPVPVVEGYIEGYRNGGQQANLNVSVSVVYTQDFADPAKGQQAAMDLINQGVDVIFNVAGCSGSSGILYAAQQGVWVIGVDFDEYFTTFGGGTTPGANRLLSSALKEVDLAVFDTINDVVTGGFTSGTVLYDLAQLNSAASVYTIAPDNEVLTRLIRLQGTGSIGLAPFHDAETSIPQSVKDDVDAVRQGIIDGTTDVNFSGRLYLPIVLKNTGS
jgi:basic membrane protein A